MSITKRESHMLRALDAPWGSDFFDMAERFRRLMSLGSPFDGSDIGSQLLRIETFADAGDIVIRAELPGLDPRTDIDLSVDEDVLTISASREERSEEERPDGYRTEFRYGSFVRSLRLPDGVEEKDVRATYKHGILEVRVPNPPQAQPTPPRKIAISRS